MFYRRLMGVILFLFCSSAYSQECVDSDGDGWGWNGFASCLVSEGTSVPTNTRECVDSDGDGWGWDGVASCTVSPSNNSRSIDYLGRCLDDNNDGWGWDGTKACQVQYHRDVRRLGAWTCDDYVIGQYSDGVTTYGDAVCIGKPVPEYISPCWNNRQLSQSNNPQWCNQHPRDAYPEDTQALGAVWLDWSNTVDEGAQPTYEIPYRREGNQFVRFEKYNVYRNGVFLGSTSNEMWVDNESVQGANSIYTIEFVYDGFRLSREIFVKPSDISIKNQDDFDTYFKNVGLVRLLDEINEIPTLEDYVIDAWAGTAVGILLYTTHGIQTMGLRPAMRGLLGRGTAIGALYGALASTAWSISDSDPYDVYSEVTDAANLFLGSYGITLPNEFDDAGYHFASGDPQHLFQYDLMVPLIRNWRDTNWEFYGNDEKLLISKFVVSTVSAIARVRNTMAYPKKIRGLSYPGDYWTYYGALQICHQISSVNQLPLACNTVTD